MNTLWRKAIRDVLGERIRSASIVLALAIGIAGFFSVLSAYAVITRSLNEGYRATNPPSATLAVDRLDDELVRAVLAMPGIGGAEARRTVRGRVKAGPAEWMNLVLFVRRDFEASRIGTLSPEGGDWPPRAGDIAIERDALQVARAKVGDVVTVRTGTGDDQALRVSGSVHDVGQAQARMENMVYGYVTLDTLTSLGEEPYYDELAIRVAESPLDEAHIHDVASAVAGAIEARGHPVARIEVPEPGQHPHAKLMEMLTLSIAVFGFFILALSGVIVFNVLTALLAGQARQIGVMKALGGSRAQIAGVYLIEAGLLGVAAIVPGLPIGIVGGRSLCAAMGAMLNFDIVSYAVPLWLYALVFAVAIAVPVVAAILPVWLGTRAPVREALAPNPAPGRAYRTSFLDHALSSVVGPSRVLLLAIRNTSRNRLRVVLTLLTLAVGGIFFISALNVRQSLIVTVDQLFESSRADLTVDLASDYPIDEVEQAVRKTPGVSAVEGWIATRGSLALSSAESGLTFTAKQDVVTVHGLPPESNMIAFDMASGERLDGSTSSVVLNTTLFERLGEPEMGSEVHLRIEDQDARLRVSGVAHEPFSPATAYVSRAFFEDRPRAGTVNCLRISLANLDPAAIDASKAAIEASLEQEGVRVVQAATKAERRIVYDMHFVMIYVFLMVVSCIIGGVGALGLLTTVSLNVSERRREMGVLRAIGATPARIAQIIVIEGLTVGAMAWLVATLTAIPLSRYIGNLLLRVLLKIETEITFANAPNAFIIWLGVALVGSALASLWPAWQASRMSVHDALTYE